MLRHARHCGTRRRTSSRSRHALRISGYNNLPAALSQDQDLDHHLNHEEEPKAPLEGLEHVVGLSSWRSTDSCPSIRRDATATNRPLRYVSEVGHSSQNGEAAAWLDPPSLGQVQLLLRTKLHFYQMSALGSGCYSHRGLRDYSTALSLRGNKQCTARTKQTHWLILSSRPSSSQTSWHRAAGSPSTSCPEPASRQPAPWRSV